MVSALDSDRAVQVRAPAGALRCILGKTLYSYIVPSSEANDPNNCDVNFKTLTLKQLKVSKKYM